MMQVAITGATGFVGRQIARRFAEAGAKCRCWYRRTRPMDAEYDWIPGELGDEDSVRRLLDGAHTLVHAGLYRVQGEGFRDSAGDQLCEYAQRNVMGSLQLFDAARRAGVQRIVFISTCAVHEDILQDRPLDERHPRSPRTHYGAYKAAIEQFIYSLGHGDGYPICGIRPCGVFGLDRPIWKSRWYDLVRDLYVEQKVQCQGGGKTVHVDDVARAVQVLAATPEEQMRGEVFNCCDRYWSHWDIAQMANEIMGRNGVVEGATRVAQNTIDNQKLTKLGFSFAGVEVVHETLSQLASEIEKTVATGP